MPKYIVRQTISANIAQRVTAATIEEAKAESEKFTKGLIEGAFQAETSGDVAHVTEVKITGVDEESQEIELATHDHIDVDKRYDRPVDESLYQILTLNDADKPIFDPKTGRRYTRRQLLAAHIIVWSMLALICAALFILVLCKGG